MSLSRMFYYTDDHHRAIEIVFHAALKRFVYFKT